MTILHSMVLVYTEYWGLQNSLGHFCTQCRIQGAHRIILTDYLGLTLTKWRTELTWAINLVRAWSKAILVISSFLDINAVVQTPIVIIYIRRNFVESKITNIWNPFPGTAAWRNILRYGNHDEAGKENGKDDP